MASIHDLNSDTSDDSENDFDYVPPTAANQNDHSHDEDANSEVDSEDEEKGRKTKRKRKKQKTEEEEPQIEDKPELTAEEQKKKVEDLWSDFKKSVDSNTKKPVPVSTNTDLKNSEKKSDIPCLLPKPAKMTVAELFDFAGETVTVTKKVIVTLPSSIVTNASPKTSTTTTTSSVPTVSNILPKKPAGGLSALVGGLAKKQKMSTLQKSLYDWKSFKQTEGIEEELEHHNKGKGGYLEKQRFLERSDVRQFEIERDLRISRRTKI